MVLDFLDERSSTVVMGGRSEAVALLLLSRSGGCVVGLERSVGSNSVREVSRLLLTFYCVVAGSILDL